MWSNHSTGLGMSKSLNDGRDEKSNMTCSRPEHPYPGALGHRLTGNMTRGRGHVPMAKNSAKLRYSVTLLQGGNGGCGESYSLGKLHDLVMVKHQPCLGPGYLTYMVASMCMACVIETWIARTSNNEHG